MDGKSNLINRIKGFFLIGLFMLGILAVGVPVQAHFTLGDLTGTYPYHTNDFDPHVPGVIGYVWPGSGQCAYLGFPNQANDNCAPGYQAPYPNGNPPGAPSNSWYQLQGDTYAPFGAILTGTSGDLIFALNATAWSTAACQASNGGAGCTRFSGRWQGVDILIPPGFSVPGSPQVVSTITNDYSSIAVARISPNDRYAPGWTLVEVLADAGFDSSNPSPAQPSPSILQSPRHRLLNGRRMVLCSNQRRTRTVRCGTVLLQDPPPWRDTVNLWRGRNGYRWRSSHFG